MAIGRFNKPQPPLDVDATGELELARQQDETNQNPALEEFAKLVVSKEALEARLASIHTSTPRPAPHPTMPDATVYHEGVEEYGEVIEPEEYDDRTRILEQVPTHQVTVSKPHPRARVEEELQAPKRSKRSGKDIVVVDKPEAEGSRRGKARYYAAIGVVAVGALFFGHHTKTKNLEKQIAAAEKLEVKVIAADMKPEAQINCVQRIVRMSPQVPVTTVPESIGSWIPKTPSSDMNVGEMQKNYLPEDSQEYVDIQQPQIKIVRNVPYLAFQFDKPASGQPKDIAAVTAYVRNPMSYTRMKDEDRSKPANKKTGQAAQKHMMMEMLDLNPASTGDLAPCSYTETGLMADKTPSGFQVSFGSALPKSVEDYITTHRIAETVKPLQNQIG